MREDEKEREQRKAEAEAAALNRQHEVLKLAYQEVCTSYHAIDSFRGTLLGLLPLASGAGILLLVNNAQLDPAKTTLVTQYAALIGIFGFVVTLGLFFYELNGIRRCNQLITDGQRLEEELGVKGQFRCYPKDVAGFIGPPLAARVIYPVVLAAWAFVALLPASPLVSAVGAALVLVVAMIWSFRLKLGQVHLGGCDESP